MATMEEIFTCDWKFLSVIKRPSDPPKELVMHNQNYNILALYLLILKVPG